MHKEPDWTQNVLLMKNSQFLSNFDQTLSKDPMDGLVNWTKFGYDYINIVNFSLRAYFEASPVLYASVSTFYVKSTF